ncbi:Gfo/Idh/MocA family oxidoreductase [Rubripirellula amarantea]|nr:Gfo/Idh/MocA family oxidoreductase [Rubripirellula amarantea]MDA8744031.1 Gfo/Idh/MocA family oxidoreductase [Rubripirellula amarantea]
MKIRVGLIGSGDAWKTRHGPSLRVLQDRLDVRAVFTTVPRLTENIAGEFQADAVDGYRAMITRCDIDAVLILEKTWLGWLPMLAACEAGKAIYWAGDLDVDVQNDQNVRRLIEESGVSFMAEFPRRFAPATLRLKELIATRLGKPRMIFCHRRMLQTEAACISGHADPVRHELLELIDWCRYVVGRKPTKVLSMSHPVDPGPHGSNESSDYRSLSLGFAGTEDSPPVTTQLSCGSYIPAAWQEAMGFRSPAGMHICCERGIAFLDLPSTLVWFDEAGRNMESLDTEMPVGQQLLTNFHRCVTSLLRNVTDIDDVFSAAAVLAAARESEATGAWVKLNEADAAKP